MASTLPNLAFVRRRSWRAVKESSTQRKQAASRGACAPDLLSAETLDLSMPDASPTVVSVPTSPVSSQALSPAGAYERVVQNNAVEKCLPGGAVLGRFGMVENADCGSRFVDVSPRSAAAAQLPTLSTEDGTRSSSNDAAMDPSSTSLGQVGKSSSTGRVAGISRLNRPGIPPLMAAVQPIQSQPEDGSPRALGTVTFASNFRLQKKRTEIASCLMQQRPS